VSGRSPDGGDGATATACGAGALLLSMAALAPLFRDLSWVPAATAVVIVVALTGFGLRSARVPMIAVLPAQVLVVAMALTLLFTSSGVLGVLPGPAALQELRALFAGVGTQIQDESVPVAVTAEFELLVVALLGAAAVVVDAVAAGVRAPAGAGLVLLALVAVPASLFDTLLPWWSFVAGAVALALLLLADQADRVPRAGPGAGSAGLRAPGGAPVVAVAVIAGLVVGVAGLGVGTGGRLPSSASGGVSLNPFTQLRGQLDQPYQVPLFTVAGMTDPVYLRSLALDTYIPDQGWVLNQAVADQTLDGTLQSGPTLGTSVDLTVTPQRYDDRWLPVPGTPRRVTGTAAALTRYSYDPTLGTVYARRTQGLPGYRVRAVVPSASAAELRVAGSPLAGQGNAPDQRFYATAGIDPQVTALAAQVAGGATNTLDSAVAVNDYLRDPANGFRYDVATAPASGANTDALVSFLTVGKTGYCEQYASAMAAMLRTLGIPTRVAVGFTAGRGDATMRQITSNDAHAWVEVFFAGIGWVVFDPTPLIDGRGVIPPYVTQAQQNPAQAAPSTSAGAPTPSATAAPPAPTTVASPNQSQADQSAGGPQTAARSSAWPRRLAVIALFVVVAAAVVGAPATARMLRSARRRARGDTASAWAELLDAAADRGMDVPTSQTPRQTAVRIIERYDLGPQGACAVHALLDAVEASWYGPGTTTTASTSRSAATTLAQQPVTNALTEVIAQLRSHAPLTLRQRLLPRSLRQRPSRLTAGRSDA